MKIETKETEWQPIVVTIETREEADELLSHLTNSPTPIKNTYVLLNILDEKLS